jgi:hypothetical protein
MRVTLYGKPDCALCDECKTDLHTLQSEFGFALEERSILDDPALFAQFRYFIPVIDIEGAPLLYPPHTRATLWRALHEARLAEESARGTAA